MSEKLKKDFIELLERDREFRYTVAGYLGLSEILKRLDRLEEGQNRLWEEVRGLREGQNRLWEGQAKLWEEVRSLREGQNKLWEEVKSLREGQNKLWEGQNRLWDEVKFLRVNYDRMRKYMVSGFRDLKSSLGVAFEDHAASFLELMLEEMGYPEARVEKKFFVHDGEIVEVNLFCEKPLVVGEATVSVKDAREAEAEVEKLLKRVKVVEEKYGKPEMIILSVARPTDEAAKTLKDLAERHGIRLVLGKEIEEELTI
jgi:nucleotide-binding universal stress UspA family protein